jgi:triacylglycerol lipase
MPTLTPVQAAQIAEGVYLIQKMGVTAALVHPKGDNLKDGISGRFAVSAESRVTGTSGMRTWWPITGFGFVAAGIGDFKGEALIALRGTDAAQDWLTDANLSSIGGVHTGFATTWAVIKPQVDQFFHGRHFTKIHCIGHSLGGALATLAALHCAESHYGAPELYTFGSPRVGLDSVAQRVTRAVGAKHIHRVAHKADPVTMIPLWPFVHVPTTTEALVIGQGDLLSINPLAHSMTDSYLPVMPDSWATLTHVNPAASQREVEQWIVAVGSGRIQVQSLSERDLRMLAHSINYAMDQMQDVRTTGLGAGSYGVATGLDLLSTAELRYERVQQQVAQQVVQTSTQAAQKVGQVTQRAAVQVGQAAQRTAVQVGQAVVEAQRVEREMEAERNRQIVAAAKAIYAFTRQQAQWAGQEATQGAKAAADAHAKAMDLLDQHIYQPITRMASKAIMAAGR